MRTFVTVAAVGVLAAGFVVPVTASPTLSPAKPTATSERLIHIHSNSIAFNDKRFGPMNKNTWLPHTSVSTGA